LGERTLGELTKQDVANLIRDARAGLVTGRSGKRASETTLHHVHAVLRVGLGSALEQGLIDRNVARLLKAPSMRHRPKVILDRAEARRLMTAARGTPFGAAIILGLPTGMREGEILGLRRGDVDFERSELVVSSTVRIGYNGRWELGEPKTEAGQRSIPLPDFALDALREHLARQDPPSLLVFPSADGT
jgi:integrase